MKNNKIKKSEKAFFAMADFYGGGGQAFISVVYFFFLTSIIGLEPVLAGAVTLISEIWDAISDPLMGIIGDNTKSKMGKRRPYILIGGCLLAVAFSLIFLPVKEMEEISKFIYCTVTYLFYNTISTMINVSYSSLSSEISEDSAERDSANVLRLVVSTAGGAICTLLPSIVLDMYKGGSIDITTLYLIVGVGFGILFVGLSTMSSAMSTLKDSPIIVDTLSSLTNPFLGVLTGFVITSILQSSSATVGIVILMASQGLLELQICFFIILGCNMGSCVSALLASIGGKKNAVRSAYIHFLINIFGSAVIVALLISAYRK